MEIVLLEQARRDRDYWKRTGNERHVPYFFDFLRLSGEKVFFERFPQAFSRKSFFQAISSGNRKKSCRRRGEPIPFRRQDFFVYRHKKCTSATRVASE